MIKHSGRALAWIALAVCVSGCTGVLPWWLAVTAEPEKVEALYEPEEDTTILVWVEDNPANQMTAAESLRYRLSEELNRQLLLHEITDSVISHQEIVGIQIGDPTFSQMSMGDVAKALGADLVLHVEIDEFSLRDTPMNPLWHGKLTTYVQILDDSGNILWPEDRLDGYPVQPVEIKTTGDVSASYGAKLTQLLVLAEADHIAKLLYDHEMDPLDASRDRRLESIDLAGLTMDD